MRLWVIETAYALSTRRDITELCAHRQMLFTINVLNEQ